MSRLSFRPRPLDIHKKLPIFKSVKDFEDDDNPTTSATRSSQLLRLSVADSDFNVGHSTEVVHTPTRKLASEIPIPQFVVVDTYERDYSQTFAQPTSYLRGRGARAELGEFVEYDLDDEDEDWLQQFNREKKTLSPERLESLLFRLEVLDHKSRERAGVITPTSGSPVPVILQLDAAVETLQAQGIKLVVFRSVYSYWKEKRERWQKPILRRLQPPPPVNDTNPYNVFRPREKTQRLHTRRDPLEPVLLFTKPLVPEKLAAACIVPPSSIPAAETGAGAVKFRGRMGRGGRIIFDRWNPLSLSPVNIGNRFSFPPKPQASMPS